MDEPDLIRPKVLPEDLVSLNPSAPDNTNTEDDQYSILREDLETDARDFESPTWSLAVDQQYLKAYSKDAIKRQDVIHELIQTEINHVRTLKLLLGVYAYEVRCSLQKEEVQLERLFPRLEHLLREHQQFLNRLQQRRQDCLEPDSKQNYTINKIGDILLAQFSGELRSRLLDGYGVFCSCHTDAMNYYKDLLQNNKKFQNLMRKIGQMAIVRRLGVPEGILLVTQRITKYPVLVERLIKNTEDGTEEHKDLTLALKCLKETISLVDEQVHHYEKLRELIARLEPKSLGRMSTGLHIRREELLQHGRKLLREGVLSWRAQNRAKDVLVVLMSNLLVLLQEKDQKLIFANLDGKPAVLSLQRLIVREAAHSDRVMYLISTSDEKAEMYEFIVSSVEERTSWCQEVWQTIENFSHVIEENEEDLSNHYDFSERLRSYHENLFVIDSQLEVLLQDRLRLFSVMSETLTDSSSLPKRLLPKCSTTDLLQGAITDVESLQNQLVAGESDVPPPLATDSVDTGLPFRKATTITDLTKNGRGLQDGSRDRNQRPNSDPHLRELFLDSLELSADDETDAVWNSPLPPPPPYSFNTQKYVCVCVCVLLCVRPQVAMAQQDSEVGVLRAALAERPSRNRGDGLLVQEKQRHLEKQREELLHLQKVYNQQKQEQAEWELERQRHQLEHQALQQQLRQREEECARQEALLAEQRDALHQSRQEYQQDLERLRESARTVEKQREQLEQQQKKLNKPNIANPGPSFHLEPPQAPPLYPVDNIYPSPEHHVRPSVSSTNFQERPPQVPPRKESIMVSPIKQDVPIQLVSTTNESIKPSSVQQQIPTKLAANKGREKSSSRGKSHQRTNSAASIEVSYLIPIKPGKEGGSLKARRPTSPRSLPADLYIPPGLVLNTKPPLHSSTHSSNTHSVRKPSHGSAPHQPDHRKKKDSSSSNREDIYYC
ncbi:rho guanine nucleotide exchange factor 18-like [Astyanax mexicanus]|uniref:Rho guanine nucleotide exchange factor 18-like n=1 Tax=Astyanax mexicanus TaxID=7994 RepID=A0A8T2LPX8_ASTMX|nr:rho guanine nucleotide exchange factor 18-like [Astyanax mexicanus]